MPEDDSPAARRRIPWITIGIAVVAWIVVAVTAPALITATFSNPRTFALVAATVGALVLWSRLVARFVSHRGLQAVLRFTPAIVAFWFLAAPYFMSGTTIDDPFPVATGAAPAVAPTTTAPLESATSVPADDGATVESTASPTTTAAPGPVALVSGTFQGLTGHRGDGTATVFDLGGGDLLLRLEDFDTGPGPDLDLYVVPGEDRRSTSGGVKIADLSATGGNQNHDLPDDLTFDGPVTILVWCERFDVEVSNAVLG